MFFRLPATVLALMCVCTGADVQRIGSGLQLFIDESLVATSHGIEWRLHRPQMAEVALTLDAPWEGSGSHYVTVFRDGPLFRMYYRCVPGRDLPASGKGWTLYVCYAESKDGIQWYRPELGLVDFLGSRKNNIVWLPKTPGFWNEGSNFAPFRDDNPNAPPSERYKATGGIERGLYAFVSPDAIHWRQRGEEPILTRTSTPLPMKNAFDSQNCFFWDSVHQQYAGYIRDSYSAPDTGESTRGIRRTTSSDFLHWTTPTWIDLGDSPAEQLYTNAITPYFRAPDVYFGFPMRLMPHRDALLPKQYDAARGKGVTDAVFMASRDGHCFQRRFLEAYIRPGLDSHNWTDRSNFVAWGIVPTGPREMSIYVLEHFRLPDIRIRRGVLRTDGFVSAGAGFHGGELTTKPLLFRGHTLVVNYSTAAAGSLRVELQDEKGAGIPAFRLSDQTPLFGDSVDQEITWERGSDVSSLAGKPVRIRFVLRDGDLYSFQFRP